MGASEVGETGESRGPVLSGSVEGPAVLARDISGGVHFSQPPPVPLEVPLPGPVFKDRDAERADLKRHLVQQAERPRQVRISVVHGPPGAGKTELSRRWAADTRDSFPGGQLHVDYADLRAYRPIGGDVAEALRECLRATGVEDAHLPGELHALAKLFRTRTSSRPVLVVLDSVTHPAQVRPLLPGAEGSAVLVAGRRLEELSDLDDAHAVQLTRLDAADGLLLFAAWSGDRDVAEREPEAAAAVVAACAGLPLALRIAGRKHHKQRRRRQLAELAAELADERRRLAALTVRTTHGEHALSAAFALAYEGLTAEEARLYRLLGLYPGKSADVGTVVCLSGADPETAEDLLYALEDAALVEEGADGRFRFHELVGLHARECAEQEESAAEREAVLERCVDYYMTGAAFADLAIFGDRLRLGGDAAHRAGAANPFQGTNARRAALAWLRAERSDALAVLQAAARHGGMHRQVWQLAESLTALYLNTRYLGDWLAACRLGATAAAADDRPDAEARLRALLSRPLCDSGELAEARAELDAALNCAGRTTNLLLRASVQEFDGRYWDLVDAQRAISSYERALELNIEAEHAHGNEEAEHARGTAIARFFLGGALASSGQRERALAELEAAEESFRRLGDDRMAARALASEAAVHAALDAPETALAAYRQAAEELRACEAHHYEAGVLRALARLEDRAGESATARELRLRALALYEESGNPLAEEVREELGSGANGEPAGDRAAVVEG
ncbi:NB-ARC domain-containing protein [Streptomyces sulphureus]|uniref:NB-ARC domain-containing protein n=1 Tax=Streptomyces sulphureus TaxID=47758 RepID=UPI001FDFDA30|nr:NB-ARC domain-containing protein [Streptomyces sulphureus]